MNDKDWDIIRASLEIVLEQQHPRLITGPSERWEVESLLNYLNAGNPT